MADKRRLVVAVFADRPAATAAGEWLKKWGETQSDTDAIKFGAMAVLTAGEDGAIEVHKVGKRDVGAGAGVGLVIGALVGAATGGVGLVAGLAAGALAGGVGGGLIHKGLGMHQSELAELTDQLCSGRAALAVVVRESESAAATEQLVDLGGSTKVYECSLEALKEGR